MPIPRPRKALACLTNGAPRPYAAAPCGVAGQKVAFSAALSAGWFDDPNGCYIAFDDADLLSLGTDLVTL